MAYAALVSLKNTIERLLDSSRISLVHPSADIAESAYEEVKSLQETLKRLDSSSKSCSRKRVNALDGQIREVVSTFEDVLEAHVLNQIRVSESSGDMEEDREEINPLSRTVMTLKRALHTMLNLQIGSQSVSNAFSVDLQDLRDDVDSFVWRVKKMEEEYIHELKNLLPEEEDEDASSRIDSGGKKTKMVGFSALLRNVRVQLMVEYEFLAITLVGMAGIGKTTLAKEIFEDPLILNHFPYRAWTTVGRKCKLDEITQDIMAQLDPGTDKMLPEGDEEIARYLKEFLKDKRCLIVLDNVWDAHVWDHLRSFFPENNNGRTRILFTSRLQEVAEHTRKSGMLAVFKIMSLLNQKESWDLLRDRVFGDDPCPAELEKVGKKIAENCEGLPLMIVTIADLLYKAEKTEEHWNKVEKKQNSVFMDAYNQISEVLLPSYEYLPQYLKSCFLYMGTFPQKYEIPRSKLFNMWIAEELLEPKTIYRTLEDYALKCLMKLVSDSLVIFHQRNSNRFYQFDNVIITCRLHSSFWHLCNREAMKNKFFLVLNSRSDSLGDDIKSQRRLCVHNNTLLGIKDVYNSMEEDCASSARSLLCLGSYHQYQVPICRRWRLLRVLDALKIRFYEFPVEVLELVQLRYLALTCNGNIPASISKLRNLQFLIIFRHLCIKYCGAPWFVPIEIWDMQELKHVQIMGRNLPNPNSSASLEKLSTLLGVSAESCSKGIFKRLSNLKKLGIQIELAPDDDGKPVQCLDQISYLIRLESLKCVVVNPEQRPPGASIPARLSVFPSGIKKLSLSGLGYPWEEMRKISLLPNLEVLKLRRNAFRGPKWEIEERQFFKLRFLLIEDTDLMHWKVGYGSLIFLNCLSIKHCYKLEKIHWKYDRNALQKVEIVDCNTWAVRWVNRLMKKTLVRRDRDRIPEPDVYIRSSWDS